MAKGKKSPDSSAVTDPVPVPRPAVSPREMRAEVDGQPSRVIHTEASASEEPPFGSISINPEFVVTLQRIFDAGQIIIPGVTGKDRCRVTRTILHKGMHVEVVCPHRGVLREMAHNECEECGHKKKKTIVYLCLLHAAEHHGGGAPIKDAGPLFGGRDEQSCEHGEVKAEESIVQTAQSQGGNCGNCLERLAYGESHFGNGKFSCDVVLDGSTGAPKKREAKQCPNCLGNLGNEETHANEDEIGGFICEKNFFKREMRSRRTKEKAHA